MTSQVYAEVNTSGIVINLVQWDGATPYNVSPNSLVLATGQPNAQVGGTYLSGVFTAPAAPAAALGIIFVNSPTSGSTLNLPNLALQQNSGPQTLYAILEPAAALASLTLNMPAQSPADGSELILYSTKAITALTLAGAQVNNPPASLAALTYYTIIWSQQYGVWFHLGPSA